MNPQYSPEIMKALADTGPVNAASTYSKPGVQNITIRTADGREFNLGNPNSIFFPLRRKIYLWRRRHEIKETKS